MQNPISNLQTSLHTDEYKAFKKEYQEFLKERKRDPYSKLKKILTEKLEREQLYDYKYYGSPTIRHGLDDHKSTLY